MVRPGLRSGYGWPAVWSLTALVVRRHESLKTVWKIYEEKENSAYSLPLVGSSGWEVWKKLSDNLIYSKANSLN